MLSKFAVDELLIYVNLNPNDIGGTKLLGLALYQYPNFVPGLASYENFLKVELSNMQEAGLGLKSTLARN